MTVKECYEALNADYEGTLGRFSMERLVQKFALKFLTDKSYGELVQFMAEENYAEAFRAAHTLKGVSVNLGFTQMYQISDEMTEALRGGKKPEEGLLEKVTEEYQRTVKVLQELAACSA